MKHLSSIIVLIILVSFSISCRKDFSTIESTGDLKFSSDTIFLDTVFTQTSTSTYALKVYNRSKKDIRIPEIYLGRGETSFYRLNVDGIPGKSFKNIELLAKDSLYIFVESTIDYGSITNPIYTDSIIFNSGDKLQDVKLVTLVQDAYFIFPNKETAISIEGDATLDGTPRQLRTLTDEELIFTNEKPYVIYGYCAVPENQKLTVNAGAKIYFHDKSALIVPKSASLEINGTASEKVILESDRLEFGYRYIAGQWDALWLQKGSNNNLINHAVIKNARIGIVCDSLSTNNSLPTLTLKNTEIHNCSSYGLLAQESFVVGENNVIGNCRINSVFLNNGGNYDFTHCTFANYWNGSIQKGKTLKISNSEVELDENEEEIIRTKNLIKAHFTNCIIDGNNQQEISLDKNDTDTFQFLFTNCSIKYSSSENNPLYDFTNTTFYNTIFPNIDADYKDTQLNDFRIGEKSEAINKAQQIAADKIPFDILGIDRKINPDLGAYQHIIFEVKEEKNQVQRLKNETSKRKF